MKTYAEYISEKEINTTNKLLGDPVVKHNGYTWHIVPTSPGAQNTRHEVIKRSKAGRHISHGIFDSHGGAVREILRKTGIKPTIAEDGGGAGGGAGAGGAAGAATGGAAPTTVTAGASVREPVVSKAKQKKIVANADGSHRPSRVPIGIRT